MQSKYPRSVRVQFVDPVPSREDEFNFWYNYIHIPDMLHTGVFDRAYRYEVIVGSAKAKYLTLWESDFSDLPSVAAKVNEALGRLKVNGRMWPVAEVVWSCDYLSIGPLAPPTGRKVAFANMAQTNCEDSSREEEFNHWYNEMHIPEYLEVDYYHSAYRYQRYDEPPDGEGKFLALYESDLDPAQLPQIQNDMGQRHVPVWYEKVGENRLKVRQQEGKSRPHDLVLQTLPSTVATWRPIFFKGGSFS